MPADEASLLNQRHRLNLGCGFDIRPGYLNVDLHAFHGPDLVADITNLNMLSSESADEIVAQDVLEHLERHKVQGALMEWSRLLAKNAIIHVRVPSLEHMFKMLCRPENRPAEHAEKIIHLMYGTQAYTGDYHFSGFTESTLTDKLAHAGLQICSGRVMDDWLFDVSARKTEELTDPTEFINNSYFRILGRFADPGGLEHYLNQISSSELSRDELIDHVANSEEAKFLQTHPSYLL